jgi:hypothetical protein
MHRCEAVTARAADVESLTDIPVSDIAIATAPIVSILTLRYRTTDLRL